MKLHNLFPAFVCLRKVLLVGVLFFVAREGAHAQGTVEAFNTSVLAGRSSAPQIRDGVGEDARFESITAMWGDGTFLYVADSLTIRRIERSTGRVTTLSHTAHSGKSRDAANSGFEYHYRGLYGLWGDGTALFGTDIGESSIKRIDLRTGGVTTVKIGVVLAWGLTGQGSNLYAGSAQNGRLLQVDSGTGSTTEFANTGPGTPPTCIGGSGCVGYFVPAPRGVWTDGSYLYVTGYSGTVQRVDLQTQAQDSLPAVPFNVGPIAGAANRLYLAAVSGPQLGSLDLATGQFTSIALPSDNLTIFAMWSDATSLYIAQGLDSQGPYQRALVIRRIDLATTAIATVAGVPDIPESADGSGSNARFQGPDGIWGEGDTLYVADRSNSTIRRIDVPTGSVITLAGVAGQSSLQDGTGTNARFVTPTGLWKTSSTLYITDSNSVRSLNLNTGQVTTIAGALTAGSVNGPGLSARFSNPGGLWGRNGLLYVADASNHAIRQVNLATNDVSTFAGSFASAGTTDGPLQTARFQSPTDLWSDGATLYVVDGSRIRAISFNDGMVRTVAVLPAAASGLWVNADALYTIVSAGSTVILAPKRRIVLYRIGISTGEVSQVVHGNDASAGLPVAFEGAGSIWGSGGNLFVTDTEDNTILRLTSSAPAFFARTEIANPGYSSQTTNGSPAGITSSQARFSASDGIVAQGGFGILSYRMDGILAAETAVPASPAIRSGRISAVAAGTVNTGVAFGNLNPVSANVDFYFTDSTGQTFGSGTFVLAAGQQTARFLTDPLFNGLFPLDATFTFASSVPISALAIRGDVNERFEFLMTTLPVVDLSPTARTMQPVSVPRCTIAGWATEFTLLNPTDQQISGAVQMVGSTPGGSSPTGYSISPRSFQRFALTPSPNPVDAGILVAPSSGFSPSANCVSVHTKSGVRVAETAVSDVPSASAFRVYGENGSSLSVINTSQHDVDVTVEIIDLQGTSDFGEKFPLHLEPLQQKSGLFGVIFAPQPSSTHLLRVSAATPDIAVTAQRARGSERGDLLLTTTPAIPEASAFVDPGLLFIPHVLNGGGFTTQIVLFGVTAQSVGTSLSVTAEYFNSAGAPVALPIR